MCYILDAIDRMGRNVQGWDGKGVGVMCLTGVNGVDGELQRSNKQMPAPLTRM